MQVVLETLEPFSGLTKVGKHGANLVPSCVNTSRWVRLLIILSEDSSLAQSMCIPFKALVALAQMLLACICALSWHRPLQPCP